MVERLPNNQPVLLAFVHKLDVLMSFGIELNGTGACLMLFFTTVFSSTTAVISPASLNKSPCPTNPSDNFSNCFYRAKRNFPSKRCLSYCNCAVNARSAINNALCCLISSSY
jgi:hypothetical protein